MKNRILAVVAAIAVLGGESVQAGPGHGHGHRHGGGDAGWWALGGFVAGAVAGAAIASSAEERVVYTTETVVAPPPPAAVAPVVVVAPPPPVRVYAPAPVVIVNGRHPHHRVRYVAPPVFVTAPPAYACPPPAVVVPPPVCAPVVVRPCRPPGFRVGISLGW